MPNTLLCDLWLGMFLFCICIQEASFLQTCFPISIFLTVSVFMECQVVGDITKESTLIPEYFKGVRKVINAVSVIVGPKEGDTPDRAKYSQVHKHLNYDIHLI